MSEEYYYKNLLGEVVDIDLQEEEDDFAPMSKKTEFSPFALTDAIAGKNRREAWIIYERFLFKGVAAEEIFWKVVWGIKNLLIASKTKSADETDMKAYPYNNAKRALKNFKEGELEKLSESLVTAYHEARRGEAEIETFLEKFILSL